MQKIFSTYLKQINAQLTTGRTTEHTHRAALQGLLDALGQDVLATNEPSREACGAPDFIVTRASITVGYVEAKDIGANLNQVEHSEQLRRYLEGLPNLILTDYLSFRLYHVGNLVIEARLGRVGSDGKIHTAAKDVTDVGKLFSCFFDAQFPAMTTPTELAQRMAATARLLRDVINRVFSSKDEGSLRGQFEGFRRVLLHDLEQDQFADMYSQTICYGLFAARCNHAASRGDFTRRSAIYDLPETNPFLREMFGHIAGPALDKRLSWAVDQLAQLLDKTDFVAILKDFGRRTRQEDPVVHFYETFLAAYDPAMREARGVYYTPEPVVSYIVRSVDKLLKKSFKIKKGLASTDKIPLFEPSHGPAQAKRKGAASVHKVLLLDPAVGTGTFLHGVIDQIHETVMQSQGQGTWNGYVSQHLLPRIFGFELLMAPYAVAHMKLGIQLAETGYAFQSGERLGVYLTNTLEEAFDLGDLPLFAHIIAEEANAAGRVKSKYPVMVVLGNPPYSGHSENKSEFITKLMRGFDSVANAPASSYFHVDGVPLGEKNPKWLNDDYVKFFRFAQWRIERTGHGIIAFISNHGYLQSPTFRGMRQSLISTFDDIYILDLHGDTKKKEEAPDGAKDENVFDIQQGVAIGIFVKHKRAGVKQPALVRHAELWGEREQFRKNAGGEATLIGGKYYQLFESDVESTPWQELEPQTPYYLFVPEDRELLSEYSSYAPVNEIFPVNSVGIVTARDALTIHFSEEELLGTIHKFTSLDPESARAQFNLGDDVEDWRVKWAQEDLFSSEMSNSFVRSITYRPFDTRFCYYTGKSRGFICRPRHKIMRHLLTRANLALITTRSIEIGRGWEHVFCTRDLIQHHSVSLKEVNYLFPLYLYGKNGDEVSDIEELAEAEENHRNGVHRKANISTAFVETLSEQLSLKFVSDGRGDLKTSFGPEDVFYYVYAVLHSPSYRSRYSQFLKRDYPRIPTPASKRLFRILAGFGARLTEVHLLKAKQQTKVRFPASGSNIIERADYEPTARKVAINQEQYFENIPLQVWDFHIGGYQVCRRWLLDRRGRTLSYDDLTHYSNMVEAIANSISIMKQIDKAIESIGSWPLS